MHALPCRAIALWSSDASLLYIDGCPDFENAIGEKPWALVDSAHRDACASAFGLASFGDSPQPLEFTTTRNGKRWKGKARIHRLPPGVMFLSTAELLPSSIERLSSREQQVLNLLATHTPKQVAKRLEITISSVYAYMNRIAEKLNVCRTELARFAVLASMH